MFHHTKQIAGSIIGHWLSYLATQPGVDDFKPILKFFGIKHVCARVRAHAHAHTHTEARHINISLIDWLIFYSYPCRSFLLIPLINLLLCFRLQNTLKEGF